MWLHTASQTNGICTNLAKKGFLHMHHGVTHMSYTIRGIQPRVVLTWIVLAFCINISYATNSCTAQKLTERRAVFNKCSYAAKDREKWEKILSTEFMSSEESDEEFIKVRPLPWRSERSVSFLHSLDDKALKEKSPQARRQMKERKVGETSSRILPATHFPSWAITTQAV